jgi:hypothetical protein
MTLSPPGAISSNGAPSRHRDKPRAAGVRPSPVSSRCTPDAAAATDGYRGEAQSPARPEESGAASTSVDTLARLVTLTYGFVSAETIRDTLRRGVSMGRNGRFRRLAGSRRRRPDTPSEIGRRPPPRTAISVEPDRPWRARRSCTNRSPISHPRRHCRAHCRTGRCWSRVRRAPSPWPNGCERPAGRSCGRRRRRLGAPPAAGLRSPDRRWLSELSSGIGGQHAATAARYVFLRAADGHLGAAKRRQASGRGLFVGLPGGTRGVLDRSSGASGALRDRGAARFQPRTDT